MPVKNGRQYTVLSGLSLKARNGALRFDTPDRTPTTTSGERLIYVNSSNQLIFDDGSTTTILGSSGSITSHSLNDAYDDGSTITVDDLTVTLSANISSAALTISQAGSGGDILGTSSTWSISNAGAVIATALRFQDNELITFGTGADATIGWNGSLLNVAGLVDFDNNVTTQGTLTVGTTATITGAGGSDALTITAGEFQVSDGSVNIVDADNANTVTITNNTVTDNAATTGGILEIRSTSMTTGAALNIELTEAQLNGGQYLRCYDTTGTEDVFTLNENGAITIIGNTSGTDSITLTAGDITMTSGHLEMTVGDATLADGSVNITDADNAASLQVTNNTATTTAAIVDISSTSITTGALMRLNANTVTHDGEILELINAGDTTSTAAGLSITMPDITTGAARGIDIVMVGATTTVKGISVTMDAITDGDMLYLDAGGGTLSSTGFYINCNDDNAADFTVGNNGATVITGSASGTDALTLTAGDITVTSGDVTMTLGDQIVTDGSVSITDADNAATLSVVNNTATTTNAIVDISSTSVSTGALMRLDANTTAHDGEVLEIINAGDTTSTGKGISITMPDITTGAAFGLDITMVGATTTAKGISVTMDAITTGDMLYLDNGGSTLEATGFYINCNDDNVSDFTVGNNGAIVITGSATGTDAITVTAGDITVTDGDIQQTTGNYLMSNNVGVTADTGSAQGNGAQTVQFIEISVCANTGDAITLPGAIAGKQIYVVNRGAQSADVFPATSDNINETGANTAVAIAANAGRMFLGIDTTHWESWIQART